MEQLNKMITSLSLIIQSKSKIEQALFTLNAKKSNTKSLSSAGLIIIIIIIAVRRS